MSDEPLRRKSAALRKHAEELREETRRVRVMAQKLLDQMAAQPSQNSGRDDYQP
jgi:hypothetical protein